MTLLYRIYTPYTPPKLPSNPQTPTPNPYFPPPPLTQFPKFFHSLSLAVLLISLIPIPFSLFPLFLFSSFLAYFCSVSTLSFSLCHSLHCNPMCTFHPFLYLFHSSFQLIVFLKLFICSLFTSFLYSVLPFPCSRSLLLVSLIAFSHSSSVQFFFSNSFIPLFHNFSFIPFNSTPHLYFYLYHTSILLCFPILLLLCSIQTLIILFLSH